MIKIFFLFIFYFYTTSYILSLCTGTNISASFGPNNNVTVSGGCRCVPPTTYSAPYSVNNLTIENTGVLTLCSKVTDPDFGLYIKARGTIEIKNDGYIDLNGVSDISNTFTSSNRAFSNNSDQTACTPTWYNNLGASKYINWQRPGSVLSNTNMSLSNQCSDTVDSVAVSSALRKNVSNSRLTGTVFSAPVNRDITTVSSSLCANIVLGSPALNITGDRPTYSLMTIDYNQHGTHIVAGGIYPSHINFCSDVGHSLAQPFASQLTTSHVFNYRGSGMGGAVMCKGNNRPGIPTDLGGSGGGFLYLEAETLLLRTGSAIEAMGNTGLSAIKANDSTRALENTAATFNIDGGTGGGGGGAIFIKSSNITLESNSVINVQGANGGTNNMGVARTARTYRRSATILEAPNAANNDYLQHPSNGNWRLEFRTNFRVAQDTSQECLSGAWRDNNWTGNNSSIEDADGSKPASSTFDPSPGGRGVDGTVILLYSNNYVNSGANIKSVKLIRNTTVGSYEPYILRDTDSIFGEAPWRNVYTISSLKLTSTFAAPANAYYINNYLNFAGAARISNSNNPITWLQIDNIQYSPAAIPIDSSFLGSTYFSINNIELGISGYSFQNVCASQVTNECQDTSIASSFLVKPNFWSNSSSYAADSGIGGSLNTYNLKLSNAGISAQLGNIFYSSYSVPLFALSEGNFFFDIIIGNRGKLSGSNLIRTLANFTGKLDLYAPCDSIDHTCLFQSTSVNTFTPSTYLTNTLDTFNFSLSIGDGNGSGINGSNNVIIVPASFTDAGALRDANNNLIPNLHIDNTNSQLGKSCDVLFAAGGVWNNVEKAELSYPLDFNSSSNKPILTNLMRNALRNLNPGVICTNNCDGNLYLLFCFRDLAGNWSRIIGYNPNTTTLLADINGDGNVANDSSLFVTTAYRGIATPRSLYQFEYSNNACSIELNNNFACYNKQPTPLLSTHIPTFAKRVFIDAPQPDIVDSDCTTDPCILPKLSREYSFLPKYTIATEVAEDVRIAYSPISWTNQQSVRVGIRLPQDKTGIKKVYYYKGISRPVLASAFRSIDVPRPIPQGICDNVRFDNIQSLITPSINWVNFCFDILNVADNETLYLLLEDNAGNNVINTITDTTPIANRKLFVDRVKPFPPERLETDINYVNSTNPILSFRKATDNPPNSVNVSGVVKYKICFWQETNNFKSNNLLQLSFGLPGVCPQGSDIDGGYGASIVVDQINTDIQNVNMPGLACCYKWNIAVYAIDAAGNYSDPSLIYTFVNSDNIPRLSFTREKFDYIVGGVSPRIGTTGFYTFKVRYTDILDRPDLKRPPSKYFLWVDIDGNGKYEDFEKISMNRLNDGTQYGDGDFSNGENYELIVNLKYNKASNGKILYRFNFVSSDEQFPKSYKDQVDATKQYTLALDPYDLSKVIGMMEVRNNLVVPDSTIFPTILLKSPDKGENELIKLSIYDNYHNLVRLLYEGTYADFGRYMRWNLKDTFGMLVGPGVYNVVYEFQGTYEYKKVVVIR